MGVYVGPLGPVEDSSPSQWQMDYLEALRELDRQFPGMDRVPSPRTRIPGRILTAAVFAQRRPRQVARGSYNPPPESGVRRPRIPTPAPPQKREA